MRVRDFERAIEALSVAIFTDEMVIGPKGQEVRAAYGHNSHVWIKWDGSGQSFTCYSEEELPMEALDPRNEVEQWDRDAVYDLQFEQTSTN